MPARSRAMIACATSLGGALRYWLQTLCVSSWTSRVRHSGAAELQLDRIAASAVGPLPPLGRESSRAMVAAVTAKVSRPGWFMRLPAAGEEHSSLDAGRRDRPAPGLADEVHGEVHRHVRAVVDERQAHLPIAVGDAML